jgi:uncharacterized GH25 family protein
LGLVVPSLIVWAASPVEAHFIWVTVDRSTGQPRVQVSFSETPEPGEAHLIKKVSHTKAVVRSDHGDAFPLKLKTFEQGEHGSLVADLPFVPSFSIQATCDYGVFSRGEKPLLLQYYAKYVSFVSKSEVLSKELVAQSPLDIVPSLGPKQQIKLQIRWQGKPAKGAELTLLAPSSDSKSLTVDDEGQSEFGPTKNGIYAVRARWLEPDRSGERDGKAYHGTLHYATLTLDVPVMVVAPVILGATEPSATDLFRRAQEARAVWDNFPGFEANLTIRLGDKEASGKLTVDKTGGIELTGFPADFDTKRADVYLQSLVGHRLNDPGPPKEVEYVPGSSPTPLGVLIRFPGDEKLKSAYRIKGDVIGEVNRELPDSRFTISVMDVHRNPAGKYLPTVFTVAYWDKESSALKSTETHLNTWKRVGNFDLPDHITLLRSKPSGNDIMELELGDQRLSQSK